MKKQTHIETYIKIDRNFIKEKLEYWTDIYNLHFSILVDICVNKEFTN